MKGYIFPELQNLPKVYIIILNWNKYKDTVLCLTSCKNLTYKNLNIILVDNASSDGSGYKVAKEFPEVEFIYNKENLGYAGGNNVGIKQALKKRAEFIFVINNDVEIKSVNLIEKMTSCFKLISNLGALNPKILRNNVNLTKNKIEFKSVLYNFIKKYFLPKKSFKAPKYFDRILVERTVISGSAIMMSKKCITKTGFFNEEFFMYGEEDDFCLRALKQGFSIFALLDDQATVIHKGKTLNNNLESWKVFLMARNRFLQLRIFSFYQQLVIILLHAGSLSKKSINWLYKKKWSLIFNNLLGFYNGVKIWAKDILGLSKHGEYLIEGRRYVMKKNLSDSCNNKLKI